VLAGNAFRQHADHLQPVVINLDELSHGAAVAEQIRLASAPARRLKRSRRCSHPRKSCPPQPQIVNGGIAGPDAVQLRQVRAKAWANSRRMQGYAAATAFPAPGGVRLDHAHIALGQPWRCADAVAATLPRWSPSASPPDIAHAKLLDETQRLLPGAGPDGKHPDHRSDIRTLCPARSKSCASFARRYSERPA